MPCSTLSPAEIARYSRHLIMPEVGMSGQLRLKQSSVLLVGAGGLGSPAALYLAAAGIGRLGLVDFDVVDASNLHRQVLHGTKDVGRPKLVSARERILDVNPHVQVETHETLLSSQNALDILKGYDVVVDGSDNFPTRYLVNDACVLLGKPDVYGSIFRFEGQAAVFWAARGPCYRCLFPEPPPPGLVPNCAEAGVLGILPGIVGIIQATEAIKLVIEEGEALVGRLLLVDALAMRFRELRLKKDPACPVCSEKPTVTSLIDYERFCGVAAHAPPEVQEIEPRALKAKLDSGAGVMLLDVRNPTEWEICHIEGATLIPLAELPARIREIDGEVPIVAYCKLGGRSGRAAELLLGAGFRDVSSLKGGIDAWAREVDPRLPRY